MVEFSRRRTPQNALSQGPTGGPASPSVVQRGGNQAAAEAVQATPSVAPEVAGPAQAGAQDQAAAQATPQVQAAPAPVVPGVQQRMVLGVQIIGEGVSPSALDSCAEFVQTTVGNRPDIQQRLQREKVALVIIPRGKKMTDVAQFAGLRGRRTVDGRLWDDVRGSGGTRVAGGLWAVGVPEENLVDTASDTYGADYDVGMHEFAHTIHSKGVAGPERRRITALYRARREAGGPWTEAYGASNEQEYFAQCTNCFFGRNGRVGNNGADWLRTNDPEMYAFLVTIYGEPRQDAAGADRAQAGASSTESAPAAGAA